MLQCLFSLRQFRLMKCSFSIHSTTPRIHPRLASRLGEDFPIVVGSCSPILKEVCVHEQQVVVLSQYIKLI